MTDEPVQLVSRVSYDELIEAIIRIKDVEKFITEKVPTFAPTFSSIIRLLEAAANEIAIQDQALSSILEVISEYFEIPLPVDEAVEQSSNENVKQKSLTLDKIVGNVIWVNTTGKHPKKEDNN